MADFRVLATNRADLRGTTARTAWACSGGQSLDLADHFAHLLRGHAEFACDGLNLHMLFRFGFGGVCAVFLERAGQRKFAETWPTMFSVTNTGLNTLPLCTLNVSPTKSGVIIDRRDQVLIGFLDFVSLPSGFCPSGGRRQTGLF